MSAEFVARLAGMVVLAVAGLYAGFALATALMLPLDVWVVALALIGALMGLVLTPYLTVYPARAVRERVMQLPTPTLVAGTLGLVLGLALGALAAVPLSYLPPPFGQFLPLGIAAFTAWLGISVFIIRQNDIFNLVRGRLPRATGHIAEASKHASSSIQPVILDTSAIIDGRIADIAKTGFITSAIVVPKFVLHEVQHIADSNDVLRRNRGRRGLEVLNQLQREAVVPVRFSESDPGGGRDVDAKLVALAKQMNGALVTSDYNLNHVAQLQGVPVLNINDLANAVRAVFLPGENLRIRLVQEGKEYNQGVGYLDDGTMVVVDDGKRYLEHEVDTVVTKILQTSAGRMIFARLDKNAPPPGNNH